METKNLLPVLPATIFGVALLVLLGKQDAGDRSQSEETTGGVQHQIAGLVPGGGGTEAAISSGNRRYLQVIDQGVRFRRPTATNLRPPPTAFAREITIRKSSVDYKVDFDAPRNRWKYLTPEVRRQIDDAGASGGHWKYVVVHSSGSRQGGAGVFDRYHRDVRQIEGGLAYHFVIGNGSQSGDGEVEVGERWRTQTGGEHLKSSRLNATSIGVCLVGDFDHHRVREAQLEALDELIDYLRAKVGTVEVVTHRQIGVIPSSCPGRYFPSKIIAE